MIFFPNYSLSTLFLHKSSHFLKTPNYIDTIENTISEIIDDLGLDSNSALALLNEGKKALEKGNKAKAKEYFAKGIKASEAEGNNLTTSSYLSMAASSFQNVNDSVSAIPYLKRGLYILALPKVLSAFLILKDLKLFKD